MKMVRRGAILLALLVLALAVCLPVLEAFHRCPGERCPVCACLAVCRRVLAGLCLPAAGLAAAELRRLSGPERGRERPAAPTPVTLRVRLLD